ncbi:hypothetical protein BB561_004251 [Smittium simulii]|uniref:FAD synthase n=1 Tax=Smittium simulii TaxID=133385 RepID=A0A2T9YHA9_9FUNG|nr:hypothetical protein BB561_004251 [Smittium simulii]
MNLSATLNSIYRLASTNTPLGRKVYLSLEIIQLSIDIYGFDLTSLSFNGGKDCTVTLFLILAALNINKNVSDQTTTVLSLEFFKDQTNLFERLNLAFRNSTCTDSSYTNPKDLSIKSSTFSKEQLTSLQRNDSKYELSAEVFDELCSILNVRFLELFEGTESIKDLFYNTKVSHFIFNYDSLYSSKIDLSALTQIKALYVKNNSVFPEVSEFIKAITDNCKLDLDVISNSMKEALFEYKKINPHCQAFYIGTRRDDPAGKYSDYFKLCDPGWPQYMRICPVFDWSYKHIWSFIIENDIPRCSMYDKGYTSIGDIEHTTTNPDLLINGSYKPAWLLSDSTLERNGRI